MDAVVVASRPYFIGFLNMRRRFIDIGANLTDPQFRGFYRSSQKHSDDFKQVLARAKESGVVRILVTGSNLEESRAALELSRQNPGFLTNTVGVHPCHAADLPADPVEQKTYLQDLEQLALDGKAEGHVKAFGEIGLDYDRLHYASAEQQKQVFQTQLEIAQRVGLPLFLHSRNAAADFYRMVKPYAQTLGGVVHSFTGTEQELSELLSLGLFIGINGCSLKTQENLDVVRALPLNRLLLETDGPWCEIRRTHASFQYTKPLPYEYAKKPEKWQYGQMVRGRCEPCAIGNVSQVCAAVKEVPEQEVIEAALKNTVELFKYDLELQNE